ncbi:hypothetical protein [Methylobacterium sp. Leaf100]|uniref:hypothetical protein n=1 Tax=Methylobacterium sp. Leaf100 TaxID=1736252 RepID=UPI0006F35FAB|nr:hypothetical protein [Methylobacterium sp. Leaf100]KQP32817.1 hypothetical protein ASF25_17520 [Methylobacterium sp. Leaf100]
MPFIWLRQRLVRSQILAPTPAAAGGDATATESPAARWPAAAIKVPSLATATRDYARAIDADTFDRLGAAEHRRLSLAMGAEIWAWQRARRLTSQTPWRASPAREERCERISAMQQMMDDLATWEHALAALDAETARARIYDRPVPPDLEVPSAVMRLIEAKRAAALERAARRQTRTDGGGGGPTLVPDDAVHHPPPPRKPI